MKNIDPKKFQAIKRFGRVLRMAAALAAIQMCCICMRAEPPDNCLSLFYEEHFTAGLGGWTLSNDDPLGSGNGLWHLTSACSATIQAGHEGTQALGYVDDETCDYVVDLGEGDIPNGGVSYSPVIDLTNAVPPLSLTFNYFVETADKGITGDFAIVLVRKADDTIVGLGGNNTLVLDDPTDGWQTISFNLTPYAGQVIQIGVGFETVTTESNNAGGYFVDDFYICGTNVTPTATSTGTPTPTPTATGTPGVGRAVGDFNNSGCTDVADFLFMLDNWQVIIDGVVVNVADFLAMLDNWRAGPNC